MITHAMRKHLQYGVAVCYITIPTLAALTLVAMKTQKWDSPAAFFWTMLTALSVEAAAVIAFAASRSEWIAESATRHPAIGVALAMPKRVAFAQLVPMLLTAFAIVIGHMK